MADHQTYPEPRLQFAFQADVLLGEIQELGVVDGMRRRIVPIIGGAATGRLNATVLAGGADWQSVRPEDGLTRVLARYWLRTDDGATIAVTNPGVRRAPPDVMRKLIDGVPVSPHVYYFRTTPTFEVGEHAYRWLSESVFVAVGVRHPDRAIIRVYEIE